MTHTAWSGMGLWAAVLLLLPACSTIDRIGAAADSVSKMADRTAELASTSSEALAEVKHSVGVLDTHIESIGGQVREELPRVADATTTLLGTIERSTRETGQATTKMIERGASAIEAVAPEVRQTLTAVRETVTSTGRSLEAIAERMDGTMKALEHLTESLERSTASGAEMLQATQRDLGQTLGEAQKTLAQTSASMLRLERESVQTMHAMRDSMTKLASAFDFVANEDDEAVIGDLRRRVDSLVSLFVWVQILGALTIICVTVLFVHHKATTRARHEAVLRKLGLEPDRAS